MPPAYRLLWIGDSHATLEFQLAAEETAGIIPMRQIPDIAAASRLPAADENSLPPTIICLAEPRPGLIGFADVLALSRRWPLAQIISISSCLADGCRRSGPALPGVTCVAWHDFPARLQCWLVELAAGRPGSLGLPATARRDERWQHPARAAAVAGVRWRPQVTVAGDSAATAEAAADLVRVAGGEVIHQATGRPPIADESACIVWDRGDRIDGDLGWLELLAGQRPGRLIVLLCSFPRGDAVAAARAAGATAVLGRPADREALTGILLRARIALSAV